MAKTAWTPKPNSANLAEIADFAEFECLRKSDGNVSVQDVARVLQRQDDGSSEDAIVQVVAESFRDLLRRSEHCGTAINHYPFRVNQNGTLLQAKKASIFHAKYLPYLFLLLATRLNMKTQRKFGELDATILFEHFCVHVAINFWGGPHQHVKALNFGTGRLVKHENDDNELDRNSFKQAVDELCQLLSEGVQFDSDPDARITAKDGKLDVVVWRSFADCRDGRLIGFGQCKTGTHWHEDLAKLQPIAFTDKWMRTPLAVSPIRLYFVAERVLSNWYECSKDGGIIFDRCRLIEYATPMKKDVLTKIARWTVAAAKSEGLRI